MSPPFDPAKYLKDIGALYRADEAECLTRLMTDAQLSAPERERVTSKASGWIDAIRHSHRPAASITDLLSRFGLSSQEGLSLMCLAEALLRIPDKQTADALIRDKLSEAHWNEALGTGAPWAMNVTGWALSITGIIVKLKDPTKHNPGAALGRLMSRLGQPVVREAIRHAMQWMADQFVMGETIESAIKRAVPGMASGVRYSFDMLGEGARTAEDSERYYNIYRNAIAALGEFQSQQRLARASGISVKLSALHSRYEMAQRDRVLREMVPRLTDLCEQAARFNIPLTIDAEEADRLHLSLDVADELLKQAKLGAWDGLGFAVQAYQKRAPAVVDFLAALAKDNKRPLHIRLVKGAYWDSEIKRAQERGLNDFPVYTRKAGTDVSYLACARRMLDAGDFIKPVFGTHNALTVAHLLELSKHSGRIEFQHLHGMGEELYGLMQKDGIGCCVYAPVGNHDVLLGYLVRRILENGANSSFVHQVYDRRVPIADLTRDPVEELRSYPSVGHPVIRMPLDVFAPDRRNSMGLDLSDPFVTEPLLKDIAKPAADRKLAPTLEIEQIFALMRQGFIEWSQQPVEHRAACLERLSDLLEQNRATLMALLIKEGGKTVPDALGEVREAVDFCRYYAMRARQDFKPVALPGPTGERNMLHLVGRGVFVCISPWNFPLAIFLGQIAAALVAGNSVIAKPASQTPEIALMTASLMYQAGISQNVFHVVPGGADIGAALVKHPLVAGVAFTGSTATGRVINRALAAKDGPIVPLIAETGGQNAMIVDSSALPEQVIDDVITSAFRSAGQRCSAMRVLCLPETTADKMIGMLKGAMRELRVGDPGKLETDVGPVIDRDAWKRLLEYNARLKKEAKEIYTVEIESIGESGGVPPPLRGRLGEGASSNPNIAYDGTPPPLTPPSGGGESDLSHSTEQFSNPDAKSFFPPQAWEIPSIDWLKGEVFGPVLHIVRYKPENLGAVIAAINATGFGLTGGLHSRIESTVRQVERDLHVGNLYINRSMIGAVVGAQPFGGEGMSGTGPKAGGPHYLLRFAQERVTSNNVTAAGGNASLLMDAGR